MIRNIAFSIIIPHRDIPDLLSRCLASIPRREDVQIIVVDDNSSSDKVDFGHFPGLNDPLVEIIFTKEGKGAGYARNVGIKSATGKWILFSDADDYFTDNFIEIIDKYNNSNYDLVYFGINEVDAMTKKRIPLDKIYSKKMHKAIYNNNHDAYIYTAYGPVAKLINLSLIKENNIQFEEIPVANDTMFSIKTAYYAKNIFFDEQRIYIREKRPGSLVSLNDPKSKFVRFCVFIRVNAFLDSISKKVYKVNIFSLLLRLINFREMTYFYKGIEIIKCNNINLFLDIFKFILSLPYLIIRKIKNIILNGIKILVTP